MIDFSLSDEQRLTRELGRDFAKREIAPLARRLEESHGGEDGAAAYMEMFRKAAAAGLHSLLIPEEYGGSGRGCLDNVLVQEELGAADVGLASSINLTAGMPPMLAAGASDEQRELWLREIAEADDYVLSGALNEPDVAGSELFCPEPEPSFGVRTRALRDGDGYVISGQKAAFVSNAGVAKAFLVFARTDPDAPPLEGTSVFYVPADTPGLSLGRPTQLLGMRTSWHAEVLLDDVRVGPERRLGGEGGGLALMGAASAPMALGLAAGFVGLARRAAEVAVEYAKERRSWGRPIIGHQAIGLKLAQSDIDVRCARLLVWEAAAAVDRGDPQAARLVPAAKAHAVDMAIRVAERAVQVLGGYGVSPEYPAEKLLRDAWTGYSCDFTGDMLRLEIAAQL